MLARFGLHAAEKARYHALSSRHRHSRQFLFGLDSFANNYYSILFGKAIFNWETRLFLLLLLFLLFSGKSSLYYGVCGEMLPLILRTGRTVLLPAINDNLISVWKKFCQVFVCVIS